jgi:hypothetical protein
MGGYKRVFDQAIESVIGETHHRALQRGSKRSLLARALGELWVPTAAGQKTMLVCPNQNHGRVHTGCPKLIGHRCNYRDSGWSDANLLLYCGPCALKTRRLGPLPDSCPRRCSGPKACDKPC